MSSAAASAPNPKRSAAVPLALTTLRLLLAPLVLLLAYRHIRGLPIALCVFAALVSDYFDGMIARRTHTVTIGLRRFDSISDSIFYVSVLIAIWHLERAVVFRFKWLLIPLLTMEVVRIVFERTKFGHISAYHMWSSKAWGLLLAIATVALLGYGIGGKLVAAALIVGIINEVEGLAISVILPTARHDVPTILHAARIRRA
ncbi:MAG TPA: CDP-alcohol phosphatidyltransferase family protein [Terriglobales bacterium]|nr:CDP-alcohol phosphatidyltransferase family protein [Terriglobales bacterium]